MLSIPGNIANRLKALILVLTAILFTSKFVSGQLFLYVSPDLAWLIVVGIILALLLAGAYNAKGGAEADHVHAPGEPAHDHEHDHDHGRTSLLSLGALCLPLLLGFLIPARPLDAAAVENRGISTEVRVAANQSENVLALVPAERNVLDWVRAISSNPDPASLNGQSAVLTGFVYRDIRFAEDQFMVARFTFSCCVVDATAIGVVVEIPEAANFQNDQWVQVSGTFTQGELDGASLPVLVADEVLPIQAPDQPYLFQ